MKNLPWVAADVAVKSMPRFRREFTLESVPAKMRLRISGVGYYVLWLNGQRADDARLTPTFSRYDVRTYFREIDVTKFLHPGVNCCEVQLGGGWYAGNFADVHGNEHASYRSVPKFALRMFSGKKTFLQSDAAWLCRESGVLADSPRTGETFDARQHSLEAWIPARIVPGPGGKLVRSDAPPVRAQAPLAAVAVYPVSAGKVLYDFGENLTGVARIQVRGKAGSEVVLRYGELRAGNGGVSQANINWYIKAGECQTDRYFLAGTTGGETWQPEFSCHGFRYLEIKFPKDVEVLNAEAVPLRSDFAPIGTVESDNAAFNALLEVTKRTLTSNFIGYPTDCPHREKNGWLADAHLASDSLLTWFDAGANYAEYLETVFDYQRPDGHFPGFVPGSGFGWHWDFGAVWDSAPLLIAYKIWQQSGDLRLLRRHYRDLTRYMEFCRTLCVDGILVFGAAEWCAPKDVPASDSRIVCSAYFYRNFMLLAEIAEALGYPDDAAKWSAEAADLQEKLGALTPQTVTEKGALLECGLGDGRLAADLAQCTRNAQFRAEFGIVGAKAIPRALAQYGYIDEAMECFLQPEFPGWQWMLNEGATTLWETWDGKQSQNHPMLGDVAGWAERYLAGVQIATPGMTEAVIAPQFPTQLHSFRWTKKTVSGEWSVAWKTLPGAKIEVQIAVPKNCQAVVHLPGKAALQVSGKKKFTVSQ